MLKSKKKVLFLSRPLTNTLDEGSKNLVYYICKNFKNHDSIIITNDEFSLPLPSNVKTKSINRMIDSSIDKHSSSIVIKLKLIIITLSFWKYDLIHSFFTLTPLNAIILLITKKIFRKKLLINLPTLDRDEINSMIIKYLIKSADRVIVMSKYTLRYVKDITSKYSLIEPTVDEQRYFKVDIEEKARIKKKLGINSKLIVIYSGEYKRTGAIENLVKIIKKTSLSNNQVLFIFSCRIKYEVEMTIREKLKERLINDNVLFLDTIKNYHEYAKISDIAIFPASNMSGKFDLPLALIELMKVGCPVIHTNTIPLDELYKNAKGLCLENNPDEIYFKLIEMINSSELLKKYVNHTINESIRFSPKKIIPMYEEVYADVL